jgi:hypothetical protein
MDAGDPITYTVYAYILVHCTQYASAVLRVRQCSRCQHRRSVTHAHHSIWPKLCRKQSAHAENPVHTTTWPSASPAPDLSPCLTQAHQPTFSTSTHHSSVPCVRALSSHDTLPLSTLPVSLDVYSTTKLALGVAFRSRAGTLRECTVPMNQPVAVFESQPCKMCLPMSSCSSSSVPSAGGSLVIVQPAGEPFYQKRTFKAADR